MADRFEIFRKVAELQERIGEFYEELGAMRLQITELIEENQRLTMENANLHARASLYAEEQAPIPGEASVFLGKLYDDGFHVCNVNYGGLRKGDCLFCMQNLQRT